VAATVVAGIPSQRPELGRGGLLPTTLPWSHPRPRDIGTKLILRFAAITVAQNIDHSGRNTMRKLMIAPLAGVAGAVLALSAAHAQGTVKIGLMNVLSGQFADAGIQLDNGVKTYMKQYGDTVAGKKIEIIRKDVGGPAPDVAKRLAQELVVRDNVDMLAGFLLTPNALAAADVSAQAKKFMVVMNAATSIIITKSPYMIRSSVTLPQVMETFGTWAAKSGIKKCYTMVTDYGPGHDSEAAFQRAFKEAGGEIIGSVRFPVANPDFSAFVQRAKDMNPECIYVFIPGGAQPAALGKAFAERGIDLSKTKILASGEATAEQALKSMGDAGLGIISAWHYDYKSNAPLNVAFVKAFNEMHGRNPDFFSIGGYDGMHAIYETLKKTGGKTDSDSLIAAAKGLKWDSPRGVVSIDPETRDIVQTIYIRKVEKVGGELVNVPFDKIENVKDPSRARGG
jgi:branched-chain amino acid transport system substrate-binding protein